MVSYYCFLSQVAAVFFNYFASRYACGFVASLELTVVLSLLLADDVSRLLVISFTQQNLCSCLPFGSSSYIDSVCFFFAQRLAQIEINEAWRAKPATDPTVLPKGKAQAK
jgi:hypothetical protein